MLAPVLKSARFGGVIHCNNLTDEQKDNKFGRVTLQSALTARRECGEPLLIPVERERLAFLTLEWLQLEQCYVNCLAIHNSSSTAMISSLVALF